MDNIEYNKKLIERMPYLYPRKDVYGELSIEDYDYSYTLLDTAEIPQGWDKLFLQLCEDIRQPLIDCGEIDTFKFIQVKEKFNELRCYHNSNSKEVIDIINKYAHISRYICCKCGNPAMDETEGYILSYCTDCWKDYVRHENVHSIQFEPTLIIRKYSRDGIETETLDCADIWERLYAD